jgi:hypothetical protein
MKYYQWLTFNTLLEFWFPKYAGNHAGEEKREEGQVLPAFYKAEFLRKAVSQPYEGKIRVRNNPLSCAIPSTRPTFGRPCGWRRAR